MYRVSERLQSSGLRGDGVTLFSLNGRFCAVHDSVPTDSDFNAVRIGSGCHGNASYELIGSLALLPAEPEVARHLGRAAWWSRQADGAGPQRALVGAGVGIETTFLKAIEEQAHRLSASHRPDPIIKQLRDVQAAADKVAAQVNKRRRESPELCNTPEWSAIGDVGNLLVAIDPPPGLEVSRSTLDNLLGEVNRRLLTAKADLLKEIPLLLAAGDSTRKFWIVRHALRNFSIDTLTTDSETARALLDLRETESVTGRAQPRSRPPSPARPRERVRQPSP